MQALLDKYSNGKIEIKFNLVKPLIEDKRRRKLIFVFKIIFLLVFLLSLVGFLMMFDSIAPDHKLISFTLTTLLIYIELWVLNQFSKKWFLQFKKAGMIKFLSHQIEILDNEKEEFVSVIYTDILAVRYKGNIRKSLIWDTYPYYKSFHIKFILKNDNPIIVESEFQLYLTSNDLKQFREIEPNIIAVLKEINPKFGVREVDKPFNDFHLF